MLGKEVWIWVIIVSGYNSCCVTSFRLTSSHHLFHFSNELRPNRIAPITPCRHARVGELTGDTARVYDLVARHFIASVSHDAVWKSTTIHLSIEEVGAKGNFAIHGKQLVTP